MDERETQHPIFPMPQTVCEYITAGSLPQWEQLPPKSQQELVQALATLLAGLPQVRALEAGHDPQP
jgi:hypothetical protein